MEILRQIFLTQIIFVVMKVSFQQAMAAQTDQDFFMQYGNDYPKDCQDVIDRCTENRASGVYLIKPEGYEEPFEVFCDQDTDGGGWTVIQRRKDNSIMFDRPWQYYKEGFGFLHQEFWCGNDKLAFLTNQRKYKLRIEFDPDRRNKFVLYDDFQISDEKGLYKLVSLGDYSTSARPNPGDRMASQVGAIFSTRDRFNSTISACANRPTAGGWWFNGGCRKTNLNGEYGSNGVQGFRWNSYDSLSFSEMKIKPADLV